MHVYMYVRQMHVHRQYRQFACKHYTLYINLSSKKQTVTESVLLRLDSPHLPSTAVQVADSFTVNLAFLRAKSYDRAYGHAIQRCLLVIHTIVTHSCTVVHVTYYTANADGRPQRKPPHAQQCSILASQA